MGAQWKAIYVARFRADMTREAAGRYWTDVHAPMAAVLDDMVGYVQSHVVGPLEDIDERSAAIGFDGYACEWWRDRLSFEAGMRSEAWATIVADGPQFLEVSELSGMSVAVDERVLADGPPAPHKLACFVRFRDGIDRGEAAEHWLRVQGPLDLGRPGLVRYVQNLVVGSLRPGGVIGEERAHFDGLAELWFEDAGALAAASEAAAAVFSGGVEFLEPWVGPSMCATVAERVIKAP